MSDIDFDNRSRVLYKPTTTANYIIRLDGDVGEPQDHDDLLEALYTVEEGDTVDLYINSLGGHLYTAIQIIDAIQRCKGTVIGHLVGVGHSAASAIYLACQGWSVTPLGFMMIHNETGGCWGKNHERASEHEFNKTFNPFMLKTMYEGFLTEEEIQSVIEGKDIWLDSENITERLEGLAKYRQAVIDQLEEGE